MGEGERLEERKEWDKNKRDKRAKVKNTKDLNQQREKDKRERIFRKEDEK